jgi:hypothetical protein
MAHIGKQSGKMVYGLLWPKYLDELEIEFDMCRRGGSFSGRNGKKYGNGLFFHYRRAMQLMWPRHLAQVEQPHCRKLLQRNCAPWPFSGLLLPENACLRAVRYYDYFIWSDSTTVIVCSTTKELLEQRVFGEINGSGGP